LIKIKVQAPRIGMYETHESHAEILVPVLTCLIMCVQIFQNKKKKSEI
jgi:hypothetical protein